MPRDFSKVVPSIWRSRRFLALETDAKLVMLYTLTCDHQNSAGCYRLPAAYGGADLCWLVDRFSLALQQLSSAGLIVHDPATDEIYITNWFVHSPPTNIDHFEGVKRIICRLDSDAVQEAAEQELDTAWSEHQTRRAAVAAKAEERRLKAGRTN